MSYFPFMIIVVSALATAAQDINLSGKVTNALTDSPLINVIVTLINRPQLIDTTGADGSYRLQATVGITHSAIKEISLSQNRLNNGVLEIGLTKSQAVTVETYSLGGALTARLAYDDMMAPGLYKFDMRKSCTNTTMFLIKVRQGDETKTYPVLSLNASFTNNTSTDRQSGGPAKSATFIDTIICSLNGFTTVKRAIIAAASVNNIALSPVVSSGTITDVDGNVYPTVMIGTQEWMAENLKTTKYKDGTSIPNVTTRPISNDWWNYGKPAYCWYNNDSANKNIYGALYNWYATNTGKLAPTGWHIPTDADWKTLITFLGGELVAGGKMKESGTTHWASPNIGGTNASGFTALPGGYINHYGTFYSIDTVGYWWVAGGYNFYSISNSYKYISYSGTDAGEHAVSVRCVRD